MNLAASSNETQDRLRDYYAQGKESALTSKDKEIKERIELAFGLWVEHKQKSIVVKMLMDQRGISRAQAFRDLSMAEQLLYNINKYSKEFLRYTITESAFQEIQEIENKMAAPENKGNTKLWISLSERRDKAYMRISKSNALDKEDIQIPKFNNLIFKQIQVNLPPEQLAAIQILVQGGSVNMNALEPQKEGDE